jgi:DNA-binding MarR family transcriptional regulator
MKPSETFDFHIQTAWYGISRMYNQIASKYGYSRAIGYVLLNIDEEGIPATKIAPMLGMEPTSLSRLLRSMEEKGLIYRKGDEVDRRKVLIFLTKEGQRIRHLSSIVVKGFNEKLIKVVGKDSLKSLMTISENIQFVMEDYKEEIVSSIRSLNDK